MHDLRFPLEPVLRYRSQLVDIAQQEMGVLESQRADAARWLDGLNTRHRLRLEQLRPFQGPQMNLVEMGRRLADMERLMRLIQEQQAALARLDGLVQQKRQQLLERSREMKLIERLRDKHLLEVRRLLARREAQTLDDAGGIGFIRRRGLAR